MDSPNKTTTPITITSNTGTHSPSSTTTTPIYHFKILVPAAAAGRIIGKGGTTIAQLQKDAGARVKMSKASEFYPGTTERVCLISGPIEGILKINDFFMENFSSTSIKILVPNSTAGMIIGKGGSYIKQIKEVSGAYVQISQKCTDISLAERCVTIVGELDSIKKASAMILSKIVEDVGNSYNRELRTSSLTAATSVFSQLTSSTSSTSSSSTTNSTHMSSGSFSGSLVHNINHHNNNNNNNNFTSSNNIINNNNNNGIGSTSTSPKPNSISTCTHMPNGNIISGINNNNSIISSSGGTCCHLQQTTTTSATTASNLTPSNVTSDINSAQIIESIKLVLRVSGYGEDAVSEITSAMSTLASYGVLGIGLGLL